MHLRHCISGIELSFCSCKLFKTCISQSAFPACQKLHCPIVSKIVNSWIVLSRETREGWPQLSVETEVKRDSKRTNERGPFLVGTREFRYALAALVGPVQNIFFLSVHCFNYFVPIAKQASRQPCWVAPVS